MQNQPVSQWGNNWQGGNNYQNQSSAQNAYGNTGNLGGGSQNTAVDTQMMANYQNYYNSQMPQGYDQSQWSAAQMQHWQQWQQWQEKYQQWQQQYGKKYAETMAQMSQTPVPQTLMNKPVNPPMPPDAGPPPLPPSEEKPPLPPGPAKPPLPGANKEISKDQDDPEELSEAEKVFDAQFKQWEGEFLAWKDQNINHPDKVQYREYEKKWESWREQLLQRREQMRRKRLSKTDQSSNKTGGTTKDKTIPGLGPGKEDKSDKKPDLGSLKQPQMINQVKNQNLPNTTPSSNKQQLQAPCFDSFHPPPSFPFNMQQTGFQGFPTMGNISSYPAQSNYNDGSKDGNADFNNFNNRGFGNDMQRNFGENGPRNQGRNSMGDFSVPPPGGFKNRTEPGDVFGNANSQTNKLPSLFDITVEKPKNLEPAVTQQQQGPQDDWDFIKKKGWEKYAKDDYYDDPFENKSDGGDEDNQRWDYKEDWVGPGNRGRGGLGGNRGFGGPRGGFGEQGGFRDQGGPGGIRDQGGPGGFRDQGGPGGFRDQGAPSGFRDQGVPGGFRDQGGPGGVRDQGAPGGFREQGGPDGFRDSGGSGGYKDFGGTGGLRDSGGPGGFKDFGGSGGARDSGGPGIFRDSGGPSRPGGPGGFRDSDGPSGPGGFRDSGGPSGPSGLKDPDGPGGFIDSGGPSRPGGFRDSDEPSGSGGFRDSGGPGGLRVPGGPGGFRDSVGPGGPRDPGGSDGFRDTSGPGRPGGFRENSGPEVPNDPGGPRGSGPFRDHSGPGGFRDMGPGELGFRDAAGGIRDRGGFRGLGGMRGAGNFRGLGGVRGPVNPWKQDENRPWDNENEEWNNEERMFPWSRNNREDNRRGSRGRGAPGRQFNKFSPWSRDEGFNETDRRPEPGFRAGEGGPASSLDKNELSGYVGNLLAKLGPVLAPTDAAPSQSQEEEQEPDWKPEVFDYSDRQSKAVTEEIFMQSAIVDYEHGGTKQTFDYDHGGEKETTDYEHGGIQATIDYGHKTATGTTAQSTIDYGHKGSNTNTFDYGHEKPVFDYSHGEQSNSRSPDWRRQDKDRRSRSRSPAWSSRRRSRSPPRNTRDRFNRSRMKDRDSKNHEDNMKKDTDLDKKVDDKTVVGDGRWAGTGARASTSTTVLVEDLLCNPGRATRPQKMVFIVRGLPGSGKTYVTKLIKEKEVEMNGAAPRILCLDDYFITEVEKEVVEPETNRKVQKKVLEYEFEVGMEQHYKDSLVKAFKKTISDGFFSFVIVDSVYEKVKDFDDMWSFAKQKGFQVYVAEMDGDVATCTKRNIHKRSEKEIQSLSSAWEPAPTHHIRLDVRSLLQADAIDEVEMADADEKEEEEEQTEAGDNVDNDEDDEEVGEIVSTVSNDVGKEFTQPWRTIYNYQTTSTIQDLAQLRQQRERGRRGYGGPIWRSGRNRKR